MHPNSAHLRSSARVGVGYSIIDSRSYDATITGLFSLRQASTMASCTEGTCSRGIWAPRSPRATITPSETRIMSSKHFSESASSILAITPIDLWHKMHHCSGVIVWKARRKENSQQLIAHLNWAIEKVFVRVAMIWTDGHEHLMPTYLGIVQQHNSWDVW